MEDLLINDVIKAVKRYFWVMILLAILGGVIGRVMTPEAPPPTYEASSLFFIEPKAEELNGGFRPEDSGRFFNTAQTLINTPAILDPVLKELKLDMSFKELSDRVNVSIENNSHLYRVTVVDGDPKQATDIVNTIVKIYNHEIHNYLDVENIKIIEIAHSGEEVQILHARPKSNMIMGILMGLVLGTFAAFILNYFFPRVNTAK